MKKYSFILPLLFILGLSYWRYTYILNPNFNGEPILINIRQYGNLIASNSSVNAKSIIIYWVLFFLGNAALFLTLFSSLKKVKIILFLFLLLSVFSGIFLGVDALWVKSASLFSLGAVLKNYLLSPMFSGTAYIMVEYFHWFGKPS